MRIPSQLPANQQGSLFPDSPHLTQARPRPVPTHSSSPVTAVFSPMTGRGLSSATVPVGNRCAGNRCPGHDDRGHSDSAEALDAFFRAGVIMVKYFFGCPRCKRFVGMISTSPAESG